MPVPDGIEDETAAVLPVVYPTSYAALALRARLVRGESLLVHAAAGGVGLAAVQIGRALGARVFGTAGGPEKCEVVRDAGAELAIDSRRDDFRAVVLEATGGRGVDVVYDPVGGETTDESIRCLAWNGRLLVVGFASGTIPEIRANRILLRNIGVLGVHWPAWREHDPEAFRETFEAVFRLAREGTVAPRIAARIPLDRVPEAIRAVASRATTGKIVVVIDSRRAGGRSLSRPAGSLPDPGDAPPRGTGGGSPRPGLAGRFPGARPQVPPPRFR